MSTARSDMLSRIRAANAAAGARPVTVPRAYSSEGDLVGQLDLFRERLRDYGALVLDCAPEEIAARVAEALGDETPVLAAPGLPEHWCPEATVDAGFTPATLDAFSAVVTGCAAACAETGTLVLDGGPGQGRRALSLIPDHHVCVVTAEQVVPSVPELIAALDPSRPLTFISGPSATSDIELIRVEGVHGPRRLAVVLVS
jgi:L-lactate dehydrogenase complex protein LldG